MKNNFVLLVVLLFSTIIFGQQFQIGDRVAVKSRDFKLLDYSPSMKVYTYQFVGKIESKYLFDRKVGEIIIGIKNGVVVTTIYNLKLNTDEHRIEKSTLKRVNKTIGKELLFVPHNSFAITKGNTFVSLKICNTPLTFGQPRMVYLSTIKYSILLP
jgi:sporulation protein YlmC with PRC-barrel domain